MDLHPDFRDLLAEFARSGVEYVLLGGYAVGYYAEPRATKDLDLLVSTSAENCLRLQRALERFGAPANVSSSAARLRDGEVLFMGVPPVRIDILSSADGIDTDEAIASGMVIQLDDLNVHIISRTHLTVNKRASGRPQDLADVAALEATA